MAMGKDDPYQFSQYARATVIGFSQSQKQTQQSKHAAAQKAEEETRASLMRRANACTAIAQLMADQNTQMLAGLKAVQAERESEPKPGPVDFVARNMRNVSPNRSLIGRREQALLARSEVMAAATKHLGGAPSSTAATTSSQPSQAVLQARTRSFRGPAAADSSAELLRAAREEMERGFELTAFETATRRAPGKLAGLGKGKAFTGSVTGTWIKEVHGSEQSQSKGKHYH